MDKNLASTLPLGLLAAKRQVQRKKEFVKIDVFEAEVSHLHHISIFLDFVTDTIITLHEEVVKRFCSSLVIKDILDTSKYIALRSTSCFDHVTRNTNNFDDFRNDDGGACS